MLKQTFSTLLAATLVMSFAVYANEEGRNQRRQERHEKRHHDKGCKLVRGTVTPDISDIQFNNDGLFINDRLSFLKTAGCGFTVLKAGKSSFDVTELYRRLGTINCCTVAREYYFNVELTFDCPFQNDISALITRSSGGWTNFSDPTLNAAMIACEFTTVDVSKTGMIIQLDVVVIGSTPAQCARFFKDFIISGDEVYGWSFDAGFCRCKNRQP